MEVFFVFLLVLGFIIFFAWLAMNVTPPSWCISAWRTDGKGGWMEQPVLTVRGEDFRYATPHEYISKLKEIEQKWKGHSANLGPIYDSIYEFESISHEFTRLAAAIPPPLPIQTFVNTQSSSIKQAEASTSGQLVAASAPLFFIPEVAEDGKVALANVVKSLYSNNGKGFIYWNGELLSKNIGDAAEYAGHVFDALWAEASILHAKTFRNIETFDALPPSVFRAIDESINTIERFFSYDVTPPVPSIVVPPNTDLPPDPLERVHTIQTYIEKGIDNDDEYRELLALATSSYVPYCMRKILIAVSSPDQSLSESLPLDFTWLAVALAALSNIEKSNAHFSQRCISLAVKCAAQVPRANMYFANIATTFQDCGLQVPEYSPHATGDYSVRLAFDGSIAVVPRNTPLATSWAVIPAPPDTSAAAPQSEGDVLKAIEKSLFGVVGIERLKPLLAMDLYEFLSGRQSRGRLYWGAPGVGKTELAQRLAGLREGYPGLTLGTGQVRYVSGVDGKLEIKEIVDSLPPVSVLFLDEADKCLDPKAGMVSPAEATQVRHAIITHFQRKPVLWIFLGVFAQMRHDGAITDEAVRATFGDELAHRLDYADWEFPSWTLENLLKAVNGASSRRKLNYEDDAALALAQYCINSGGGVRAFDNLEAAIVRHVRTSGGPDGGKVPLAVAQMILAKRGVQTV